MKEQQHTVVMQLSQRECPVIHWPYRW